MKRSKRTGGREGAHVPDPLGRVVGWVDGLAMGTVGAYVNPDTVGNFVGASEGALVGPSDGALVFTVGDYKTEINCEVY